MIEYNRTVRRMETMGIFDKITTKAGNKAFGIQEIKKRSELPTSQEELLERRKKLKKLFIRSH